MKSLKEFITESLPKNGEVHMYITKDHSGPLVKFIDSRGTTMTKTLTPFSAKFYANDWTDAGITKLIIHGKLSTQHLKFAKNIEKKSKIKYSEKG